MPWMPYSERQARDRAADELRKNPVRSDAVIAEIAGVGSSTVALARHALEQMYQIGRVPLGQRQARPRPRQPSRAREVIQAHPDWSLQRVAAAAGVSVQSAWKMSRKTPQLSDAAAVTDSISVLRLIPVPCPRCGEPFLASDRRRYCSPACKAAAEARRHSLADAMRGMDRPAHPPSVHAHPPPLIPALPPAPDWSRGRCTTAPPGQRTWWTSDDPDEKQAARSMCQGCPVRPECEQWSLALPLSDPGIYGGLTPAERAKRRRAWLLAIAASVKTRRLSWVRVPGVSVSGVSYDQAQSRSAGAHAGKGCRAPGTRPAATPARARRSRTSRYDRTQGWRSTAQARSAPRHGGFNPHVRLEIGAYCAHGL